MGRALQQNTEMVGDLSLWSSVLSAPFSLVPAAQHRLFSVPPILFSSSLRKTCSQERDKFTYFEIVRLSATFLEDHLHFNRGKALSQRNEILLTECLGIN